MILIDANILLHAYNTSSPRHPRAREWFEKVMNGTVPVRFSWTTVLAFIRIGTHARVFPRPLSGPEAADIVSEWLSRPPAGILEPGERHWGILEGFLREAQVHGPLVMDAHLAALAIEHGATLFTSDEDFHRFPGLQFQNPLIPR